MRAVVRQPSVTVRQQADQVEQRSDVRVGLAIVVAEQPLVVADQAGVYVGGDQLPVLGESLGSRELERAVVSPGATKTSNSRVTACGFFRRSRVSAARIEEEVVAPVVKGTVLNDVVLRPVDAANTEGKVPERLIFDASRILIDCLRPQTRINRRRIASEISEVDDSGSPRRAVQPVSVDVEVGLHQVAAGAHVNV